MSSKRSVKSLLKKARARTEPFTARIGDVTIEGEFTTLPFMKWQELVAAHPPRPDSPADEGWGFSYVSFWPAAIREAMVDPLMDDEDWDIFLEKLSSGEMVRLGSQVLTLNLRMDDVSVPKSPSTSSETPSPSSD